MHKWGVFLKPVAYSYVAMHVSLSNRYSYDVIMFIVAYLVYIAPSNLCTCIICDN